MNTLIILGKDHRMLMSLDFTDLKSRQLVFNYML